MIVYGRNAVREALRGRRSTSVTRVLATDAAARAAWLDGVTLRRASAEEIERACGSSDHQGICAEAGGYPYVGAAELIGRGGHFIVALDEVQDPHNLGAVCRTAECAGVTGIVLCERRAAAVTPAVCRASAGAVEHVRIARVPNLADFLRDAKAAGSWCYGAAVFRKRRSLRLPRLLGGGGARARRRGERAAAARGEQL